MSDPTAGQRMSAQLAEELGGLIDHCPRDFGSVLRKMLAAEELDIDYVIRRYIEDVNPPDPTNGVRWSFKTFPVPRLDHGDA